MRSLYRLLSAMATVKAASRGPAALGRNVVRKTAHKSLARSLKKGGL